MNGCTCSPVHRCEAEDGSVELTNTACEPGTVDLSNDVEQAFKW